jgi:hypothetical protein
MTPVTRRFSRFLQTAILASMACCTILGDLSSASAAPIVVSLNYQAVFGMSGTDNISGSFTFDPNGQTFTSSVSVTGPVLPGLYVADDIGLFSFPSGSDIGAMGPERGIILSGDFMPSPLTSSDIVYSSFTLYTSESGGMTSTSVTNLAAVPEPSALVLIGTYVVVFGGVLGRKARLI